LWVPILVISVVTSFLWMNTMPNHAVGINSLVALGRYFWLEGLGFTAATASVAILVLTRTLFDHPALGILRIVVMVCLAASLLMVLLKFCTPSVIKEKLDVQFAIFKNKHNWIMTYLYIATFGSFIGFAGAFPKLILDVFGTLPDGEDNPNAPNPMHFAWLGAFIGSLIRPVGGWLSDKMGGAFVTQWFCIMPLLISTVFGGVFCQLAREADKPEQWFVPFLIDYLVLFMSTGIGNGSTFRMIPVIFERSQAGPVLGFTSAIAAYGGFVIPAVFGVAIKARMPEIAMYSFAVYYLSCLFVNWYYYARKGAEKPC